jgi:hypothetical protein
MSWENMLSFMEKIESDPNLASQVKKLNDDAEGFIQLSDSHGCKINFNDLEQLAFICHADTIQDSAEEFKENSI